MIKENFVDHKKGLKRQRIKMYFLDAAKQMIFMEGVQSVSVRKVADTAGYSYATLYNYFDDINELLWDVKQLMVNDLVELMQKEMVGFSLDVAGLKRLFRIYITYYFENPNVFKLFYFHELIKPNKIREASEGGPDFDAMMKETFKVFIAEGKLGEADLEVVGKTCIYAVHGLLTMFFSGNGDQTREKVFEELDKIIDYLL